MISILIPTRNASLTVAAAIESVLRGSAVIQEILVIDGGSDDDTVAQAGTFPKVRVIEQEGRGLAAARNQVLGEASGQYVGFLDADDIFTENRFAAMLAALEVADAVIGQMIRRASGQVSAGYGADWLETPVPALTPGGLLARRSVFADVGPFDEELKIACDTDWIARLETADIPLQRIEDVVLIKHVHADNLSNDVVRYRKELLEVARRRLHRARGGER